jgi:uncharacterized protein YgiM (DUF1202 family)
MKCKKVLTVVILLFGLLSAIAGQQSRDSMWTAAQDAYLRADYASATLYFNAFLKESPASFNAMFNLGNCYARDGRIANAMLWYERAKKLRPHDQDLVYNLAIAKARRSDPVVEIQGFFALRWLRGISGYFSTTAWAIVSLLSFWALVAVSVLAIRAENWKRYKWIAVALGVMCVLTITFGAQRNKDLHRNDRAVIMDDHTEVRIAPDPKGKRVAELNGGEIVRILDTLDNYYKIRLANFEHGWVPVSALERI